ncbi:MAG: hypothetical protein RBT82_14405 [Desulfomonilia bacterium]|jgi:hypothetical protein|nr:hypothetical protein [Desulfomonilia bacterium]
MSFWWGGEYDLGGDREAGPLIRFNDAFLDFLRPLKITSIACNV